MHNLSSTLDLERRGESQRVPYSLSNQLKRTNLCLFWEITAPNMVSFVQGIIVWPLTNVSAGA